MKNILTILLLLFVFGSDAQTTFFCEATGTPYGQTGAISTWTNSASAIFRRLRATGTKESSTIASTTIAVDNSSSTATTLFAQFISPALEAQTISGTVTGHFRMSIANATGATTQSRMKITVINMAGTVVATLLAMTSGAVNLTTTLENKVNANGAALSSFACSRGDRLVVEIGIGRSAGTTARNGTISFGSSSATNLSSNGETTANNPVVTFSGNITFYKGVPF